MVSSLYQCGLLTCPAKGRLFWPKLPAPFATPLLSSPVLDSPLLSPCLLSPQLLPWPFPPHLGVCFLLPTLSEIQIKLSPLPIGCCWAMFAWVFSWPAFLASVIGGRDGGLNPQFLDPPSSSKYTTSWSCCRSRTGLLSLPDLPLEEYWSSSNSCWGCLAISCCLQAVFLTQASMTKWNWYS